MTKRGEVWLCALDPTTGSEIQKTRPCLIVSPDELNRRSPTVVAVPLTSGSRPASFRVAVQFQDKNGLILPEQIRTLDQRRLLKRLGAVEQQVLVAVLKVLGEMFAP